MGNRGYTNRANKVLKELSQIEAKKYNSDHILPEHLFLAILRLNEGVSIRAFEALNLKIDRLIADTESHLHSNDMPPHLGDVVPSDATEEALGIAAKEAISMGHNYGGTEHLVLGCMQCDESSVGEILAAYKVTADRYRDALQGVIREGRIPVMAGGGSGKAQTIQTSNRKTPYTDEYGRDLTMLARKEKLDKVVGRENEIQRLTQILARRTKNNPVLIGEPGVGKTAIAEGLAQRIVSGNVPDCLMGKRLVSLDFAQIVAGTKYRGEFEERMKKLMKEVRESGNIILFIDELHTIIGAGSAEGTMDVSNMFKPALSRGELQCIGATTLNEYKKYIEKDAALERRFQPIIVGEPDVETTTEILKGIRHLYEAHHGVTYKEECFKLAAELSQRYISDRFLPDKAIDVIDEAGAKLKLSNTAKPQQVAEMEKRIEELKTELDRLKKEEAFEECAVIKKQINEIRKEREDYLNSSVSPTAQMVVTEDTILEVVSEIAKIPLSRISEPEGKRLLHIEDELHKRIVGQDEAIATIASAVRRSRLGLSSKKRPTGSFIFLGPTGVGKTELAKSLAELIYGSENALIRVDMSDYMEKHNVSRLVGSPPGYVGYEEGGMLTEKIRRQPYSVVLLDEVEKAHPDVFNILLQILEEGELADNLGHIVSFRNTIVIMTSNIGAKQITKEVSIGFDTPDESSEYSDIKTNVMSEVKKFFNPEFINRVDDIIVFRPLTEDDLKGVIDIQFREVCDNLAEHHIGITLSEEAKAFIIEKYYDKRYGARTLRRAMQKDISDRIAVEMLEGHIKDGDTIVVLVQNEDLFFEVADEHLSKFPLTEK